MLYDPNLQFLIPGGTSPGGSTSQIFISLFQGVFPGHALRFISSFPHSRGYSPGRLYDLNLQFLIPRGISRVCSTIHIFFSSFQGILPRRTSSDHSPIQINKFQLDEAALHCRIKLELLIHSAQFFYLTPPVFFRSSSWNYDFPSGVCFFFAVILRTSNLDFPSCLRIVHDDLTYSRNLNVPGMWVLDTHHRCGDHSLHI